MSTEVPLLGILDKLFVDGACVSCSLETNVLEVSDKSIRCLSPVSGTAARLKANKAEVLSGLADMFLNAVLA